MRPAAISTRRGSRRHWAACRANASGRRRWGCCRAPSPTWLCSLDASGFAGDDNLFWRRAALLLRHRDAGASCPRPHRHRLIAHWSAPDAFPPWTGGLPDLRWVPTQALAETALELSSPPTRPSRSQCDEMVRQWYRATQLWLQSHEQHDPHHLEAGLALFRMTQCSSS